MCLLLVGGCIDASTSICRSRVDCDQEEVCINGTCKDQPEICDGADNDRDDSVDEGPDGQPLSRDCYTGSPASAGVGICQTGRQTCEQGRWSACRGEVRPVTESCDGTDTDCDDQVDEGEDGQPLSRDCYTGSGEIVGIGICQTGRQTCEQGQWSVCRGDVRPVPETCNGLDDDCDGQVDQGTGGQPIKQICHDDTKDPECFEGIRTCREDGQLGACDIKALCTEECKMKGLCAEACNGIDDDGDGYTDETADGVAIAQRCYEVPNGTAGVGVCWYGLQTCEDGVYGDCEAAGVPSEEKCDGLDNDCDGQSDEAEDLDGFCCFGNTRDEVPCNGCPAGVVVPDGWVCIPAGQFVKGSPGDECPRGAELPCLDPRCDAGSCPGPERGRNGEESQSVVTIERPFLMRATETTQDEWVAIMGDNPSHFREGGEGGCAEEPCGDRPVESMRPEKIFDFLERASERSHLTPCYSVTTIEEGASSIQLIDYVGRGMCTGLRLPTAEEWEYATRAGTSTAFWSCDIEQPTGCDPPDACLAEVGWFSCNARGRTHRVAQKRRNPWGLYDVHGNTSEWVWPANGPVLNLSASPMGPSEDNDMPSSHGPSTNMGGHGSENTVAANGRPRYLPPWISCPGCTEFNPIVLLCDGSWTGEARHARAANCSWIDIPSIEVGTAGIRPVRSIGW